MAQLFSNNAVSKLVAGISNVSLSLQISAGDGLKFPNPTEGDFFLVTLSKVNSGIESSVEVVKVTARATDVFTLVRAQEGTTALVYAEGDLASLRVTAGVVTALEAHKNSTSNPHAVTKAQVGLGDVDNTTDAAKPVSTLQAAAIALKLDASAAYTHPANHSPSIITQDSSNRFVTDAEKAAWDGKQAALVSGTNIKTVGGVSILGSGDAAIYSSSATRTLLASGTSWLCPAGVTSINLTLIGGGGGGARTNITNRPAGGGSGGATTLASGVAVTPGASYAYAIGAGGAAASTANTQGTSGGATTFGGGNSAPGGVAGSTTVLIVKQGGGTIGGGAGIQLPDFDLSWGGDSSLGFGGYALAGSTIRDASGYGAGGYGGSNAVAAAPGTAGVLIIEY